MLGWLLLLMVQWLCFQFGLLFNFQLFPLLHSWGATGVLIEWEDTFPYTGNLSAIGSLESETKAYTEDDVDRIHLLAEQFNLHVIPLVQSMGHLEVSWFEYY
jgi:hexosaminidase